MPRLRRVVPLPDDPAQRWPSLNEFLFGAPEAGGGNLAPLSGRLPIDWKQIFGADRPLTLEIGFNRGRFLTALGEAWPDHNHVGVEIRRKYAWHVSNVLADRSERRNVRVVWGDARMLVPALFEEGALDAIFVNFPDPWWKRRHAKRRLVDGDFGVQLLSRLRLGGALWVKTDVEAIGDEIRTRLEVAPGGSTAVPFDETALPPTYRERRCIAQDIPVWRFRVERTPMG